MRALRLEELPVFCLSLCPKLLPRKVKKDDAQYLAFHNTGSHQRGKIISKRKRETFVRVIEFSDLTNQWWKTKARIHEI
jgi:hypothetical protein